MELVPTACSGGKDKEEKEEKEEGEGKRGRNSLVKRETLSGFRKNSTHVLKHLLCLA